MTAARIWTGDARSWNLAALLAGAFGAACSGVLLAAQADPPSLNWPLILAPAAVVPLPLHVPGRAVRVGAAVVMGSWCWLGSGTIGMFFAPCLLLMLVAAKREDA